MDGKKLRTFIASHWLLILLGMVFLLRLPSLFEPYWYGDEGIYLVLGQAIKKGLLLYRDIFDNKPPLIYLLAAVAGGTIFWFRFFLLASVLASIYLFFQLSRKLFPREKKAIIVATITFAFLTTIRKFEGTIANSEIFILLPTVAGLNLIFHLLEQRARNYKSFFIAGLIMGLAPLLKIPAVFDFAAIFLFLALFRAKNRFISLGKKEVLFLVGYLLPLVLTGLFFLARGAFTPFFTACFKQTFGYLFSWETGSHLFSLASFVKSDLLIRSGLLLAGLGILFLRRKRLSPLLIFVPLWFIFALFAATLPGRPYPHYLIQVIPPFSLAVGLLFAKKDWLNRLLVISLFGLLALSIVRYHFWSYATLSYYQNFFQFACRQKNKTAYFAYFGQKTPQLYELAQFINESTGPQEKIFIWSNEPQLYALSRRLPIGPYTVAYHIQDLHQQKTIATLLGQQKPNLIIVNHLLPTFTELESLVNKEYRIIKATEDFTVWQRRNR
ncbi:MAG TPA: hypothetical protein VMW04_02775 [Patescibacteria group bacterium]|nr:hypothetical protein [Patescibacteria group bacterium]